MEATNDTEKANGTDKRRSKRKGIPKWWDKFLEAYVESGGNILRASRALTAAGVPGCSRTNIYDALELNPDLKAILNSLNPQVVDALEAEAIRRAVDGIEEPVIFQGDLCGYWVNAAGDRLPPNTEPNLARGDRFIPITLKKYSDNLLIRLLTARAPNQYGTHHTVSGPNGGKLEVVEEIVVIDGTSQDPAEPTPE